ASGRSSYAARVLRSLLPSVIVLVGWRTLRSSNRLYATGGVSTVSAADTVLTPGGCHRWPRSPPAYAEREGALTGKDREQTMRVLVIEDFEVLATAIGAGLRREGMAVDVALDGNDALEHLAVTRYDVVVLDRDLPGVHGDEVCRQIVAGGSQG